MAKLKGKFLPKDYKLYLFRKMQNLRKKQLTMKEYTKEFYKVNRIEEYVEDFPERVIGYINGLRFEIKDEMNLLCQISIEEEYNFSLMAKENLAWKSQARSWGTF